jgi:hypothetical protein
MAGSGAKSNAAKACVLAAFVVMILGGCATMGTLSVSPANQAALINREERPFLRSAGKNTVAVWLLTPTYRTHLRDLRPPAFLVLFRNGGSGRIILTRKDITATAGGRPIHMITYEEYCDEIERRADKALYAVEVKADWQYDNYMPGDNPYAIEQRGVRDVGSWRKALLADAQLMLVADRYLIGPNQAMWGVVRLEPSDLSSGQQLRILVRMGEETHEFVYDVRS